jgi:ectoine hydroxylase-related dioxygenase (phytanoyl-CoA dioxygenase family)
MGFRENLKYKQTLLYFLIILFVCMRYNNAKERGAMNSLRALPDALPDALEVDFSPEADSPEISASLSLASGLFGEYGCFIAKNFFNASQFEPVYRDIARLIQLRTAFANAQNLKPSEKPLHKVSRFDDGFIELCNEDRRHGSIIYDACRRLTPVNTLSADPKLNRLSGLLMQSETLMTYPYKPIRIDHPNEEKYLFLWHQDYPYNQDSTDGIVYWIPLQDVDDENGCLEIAPGSHKEGIYPVRVVDPENQQKTGARTMTLADPSVVNRYPGITIPMRAGDVLVFSNLLLHRSQLNTSARARWTIQFRHGNFENPDAIQRDWPGGLIAGAGFHKTHPEYTVL